MTIIPEDIRKYMINRENIIERNSKYYDSEILPPPMIFICYWRGVLANYYDYKILPPPPFPILIAIGELGGGG